MPKRLAVAETSLPFSFPFFPASRGEAEVLTFARTRSATYMTSGYKEFVGEILLPFLLFPPLLPFRLNA